MCDSIQISNSHFKKFLLSNSDILVMGVILVLVIRSVILYYLVTFN